MNLGNMKISEIAKIIKQDWNPVYFTAVPYLDAMEQIESIGRSIGYDRNSEIVLNFLNNSKQWKGETAREVKAYLRELIKEDI